MGSISAVLRNAPAALAQAQVCSLSGQEGISQFFSFQIEILLATGGLDLSSMPGERLAVQVSGEGGSLRCFHGRIAECAGQGPEGRYFRYRFTLRPALWFLSFNRQCRIFQGKSIIDIIKQLLPADVAVDWQCQAGYASLDYCVQYLESDAQFICRLLEENGLYYFFRHEADEHHLVIADSAAAHPAVEGGDAMVWFPTDQGGVNTLHSWQSLEQWRFSTAAACDFEYTKAMSREAGLQHAQVGEGTRLWLDYPSRAASKSAAQNVARLRSESLQTGAKRCLAETRMPAVFAGGMMTLKEHAEVSEQGNYMILETAPRLQTELSASGACNGRFHSQMVVQKEGEIFRPPRVTPRPIIAGCQTALVVGKAGEKQWIDSYGRIKLQFHWDSGENTHEACSCWVRVAQPVAGDRWGSLFLPRPGQEVVVTFLNGDPDRPLVTGSVYNAGMMPPYMLPEQGSRSGFRSRSLGDDAVFNELRFDDKAGAEQLLLRAGRNKAVSVAHDALESVGNEHHLRVSESQFIDIGGDAHGRVEGKKIQRIGSDFSLQIGGHGACKIDGKLALSADKVDVKSQSHLTLEAGARLTLKAGSSTLVLGSEGVSIDGVLINIKASGLVNINSGGGGKAVSADAPSTVTPQQAREADDGSH
ncbi:type VI secretion system tip protein VgrG [Pantoea sp. LS15]|uniref:type VI secretion system Vgr family protein n=1 Tax=Enterobacterales TaxID=91347 RepID=UPI001438CE44|nr:MULTISPECIES: type VI secretion system tip protein TssI/VgrG [Enterobacterales]NJQ21802.1 type VI secretion system tip protein VgrG [Pantoea sp. LS15]NKF48398.1 type VI secretion system tip protein VgrG [Pantoea sp. LS15]